MPDRTIQARLLTWLCGIGQRTRSTMGSNLIGRNCYSPLRPRQLQKPEFEKGKALIEGHKVFQFKDIEHSITTTIVLVAKEATLLERKTSAESIAKYRDFVRRELDDPESFLNAPRIAMLPAEMKPTTLACVAIEKIVLDCSNRDPKHLRLVNPNGDTLF